MTEHELDTLLRDYGGAVRSVCRAILPGHPQDAEEAEADTFYKLWRGAHLPADETHRRRLVVQAARQCAIDRYRALLRRGETLPLDDRDDAELAVALESELETRELMAQVMALPPPDGELFLRRYVYGETAAQLGVHFKHACRHGAHPAAPRTAGTAKAIEGGLTYDRTGTLDG